MRAALISLGSMKRLSDRVSDYIADSLGWAGPALIVIGLVLFVIARLWK